VSLAEHLRQADRQRTSSPVYPPWGMTGNTTNDGWFPPLIRVVTPEYTSEPRPWGSAWAKMPLPRIELP
jgi:hypothetical protein